MTFYEIQNGRQRLLVALPTVLTSFALFFTSMRIYARRLQKTRILADDYLCIAACIFGLALLGLNIAMAVSGGNGKSVPELQSPDDFFYWYKLSFVTYLLWVVNIAIVQLAILAFYQRIFWVVDWFRWTCYTMMAISITWCIALFITEFTVCTPVEKIWGSPVDGRCGDFDKMCHALGLTHSILDFSVLFIPVPLIWRMKISLKRKAAISILFMAGIFASIASLLRLQCLFDASQRDPTDPIKSMWLPWLYYFVEVPIAIICCSAPAMPTVYKHFPSSSLGKYASGVFGRASSSSTSRIQSRGNQPGSPSDHTLANKTSDQSIQLQIHGPL